MNLIQWKGNKIEIAPEAYGIKAYRTIWNMDKTSGKEKAILALTTLYFMYDPRSPYQIETNEEARLEAIKEETGLDKNWRPDKYFLACVPIYQKLTNTTSAIMLASNRKVVEKTRKVLEDFDFGDVDPEKRADVATKVFTSMEKSTELAVKIANAEKEIYKDVEEHSSKMRGKGKKTIGDDGLDVLFS